MHFFANRASTRYARGLERARNNAFADSKLHCLVVCMYSKQRKRAGSRLTLNAGFLTQLAGKRVGCGRCGPNPRKAGHLVCLSLCAFIQGREIQWKVSTQEMCTTHKQNMSHLKLQRGARGGWKLVIRGTVATTPCNRTDCPVKYEHNKQTNKQRNKQSIWGQIIQELDHTHAH